MNSRDVGDSSGRISVRLFLKSHSGASYGIRVCFSTFSLLVRQRPHDSNLQRKRKTREERKKQIYRFYNGDTANGGGGGNVWFFVEMRNRRTFVHFFRSSVTSVGIRRMLRNRMQS